MAGGTPDLLDQARREVIELHDFFMAWFRPVTVETAALELRRCDEALAPDFRQIAPDGQVHARDPLLQRLAAARGCRPDGFVIEVEDIRPVWQNDAAILLDYVERQYCHEPSKAGAASGETRRRSTAFFTLSTTAPQGVAWRHLQETWLQAPTT
ncbi:MAG TPA: hypothetical protein VN229_00820 [Terriglobales bacterium]|nr:hypothetical protein [Terriglobales bacterium]